MPEGAQEYIIFMRFYKRQPIAKSKSLHHFWQTWSGLTG